MFKSLLLLLLSISIAHAAEQAVASNPATTTHADPATIKELLQKNFAQMFGNVEQVNTTPIPGIYEVVMPGQVVYIDESGLYLLDGNMIDLKARRNITEERSRKLFAVDFNKLPFNLAVKKVKGNGKRKLAYFTDPNCGYCKKLENELKNVTDVTLYLFLYPIFEGSAEKVQNVWCSKDRVKAWDDMMLNGIQPQEAKCDTPIAKVQELGHKFRVNGTPALIFADGVMVPGYLPAAKLEETLNSASGH
jgi:thiol:disulfide interchange protein DsbC